MFETKTAVVASVVALTIFGAPLVAHAAPIQHKAPISIHAEDSEGEADDQDDNHDDGDHDGDDRKGWIPPVFVVPGGQAPHKHDRPRIKPGQSTSAPDDSTSTDNTGSGTDSANGASLNPVDDNDFVVVDANDPATAAKLGNVNPHQNQPVAIENVQATLRTPADQFMDTAYLGMAMLGIAALGLGGTAAVRAVRIRKSAKADYFYDNK